MWKQSLSSVVLALTLAATAQAVDLSQIDRTIAREPVYQNQAGYALLVFGPDAQTRVWLVKDGNVLYVDRNANGDLTEEGERVVPHSPTSTWYYPPDVKQADDRIYSNLMLMLLANDQFMLHVSTARGARQFVGPGSEEKPAFALDPAKAPVIHLDGPLTFGVFGPMPEVLADQERGLRMRLMIGTPGLGTGAFAGVRSRITREAVVELEYHSLQSGETRHFETRRNLTTRCGLYLGCESIPVPADAARDVVKVTISEPEDARIAPATVSVRVR